MALAGLVVLLSALLVVFAPSGLTGKMAVGGRSLSQLRSQAYRDRKWDWKRCLAGDLGTREGDQ